jgi:hypothetical protein
MPLGTFVKLFVLVGSLSIPCSEARPCEQAAPKPTIQELDWLSGSWEATLDEARLEEHWIPARGKTVLGVNRTVVGDRTVAFEFLRLEERPDGIYYVAHPNARAGTEFKLTRLDAREAVFENPEHDHPKLIRYRRNADGTLYVQIEGDEKGKRVTQDFDYRPATKD